MRGAAPRPMEPASATAGLRRHDRGTRRTDLSRGAALLAEARLRELRRPGRADRDHAPRACRASSLDLRAALPARAQLLHAAPRPRGATARDLHRLAPAWLPWRHRRGRALRRAIARDPPRAP